MAAGLQRRVGVSLAAGRQSQCLLQEDRLPSGCGDSGAPGVG